jgi:hypothetical protein
MPIRKHKSSTEKSTGKTSALPKQKASGEPTFAFDDHRSETMVQRKLQGIADQSEQVKKAIQFQSMANGHVLDPVQKEESRGSNRNGLPDSLKSGIEHLSGMDMSDVKVHYNSNKPAQLKAHAFAQGNEIHLAPGQNKHLPHEAWHVVQQKQKRVKPTTQLAAKNTPAEKTIQRVIISGPDANVETQVANREKGTAGLLSPMEMVSQLDILRSENSSMEVLKIDALAKNNEIKYDSVNYLVAHYEAHGGSFLGYLPQDMAARLKATGLKPGQKLILLGCETSGYAEKLSAELNKIDIKGVMVTAAKELAFEYPGKKGKIVEEQFKKSANRDIDDGLKRTVAAKFDFDMFKSLMRHIVPALIQLKPEITQKLWGLLNQMNFSKIDPTRAAKFGAKDVITAKVLVRPEKGEVKEELSQAEMLVNKLKNDKTLKGFVPSKNLYPLDTLLAFIRTEINGIQAEAEKGKLSSALHKIYFDKGRNKKAANRYLELLINKYGEEKLSEAHGWVSYADGKKIGETDHWRNVLVMANTVAESTKQLEALSTSLMHSVWVTLPDNVKGGIKEEVMNNVGEYPKIFKNIFRQQRATAHANSGTGGYVHS